MVCLKANVSLRQPIYCFVIYLVKSLNSSLVFSLMTFLHNVPNGLYLPVVTIGGSSLFCICVEGSYSYPAPFIFCLVWSTWLLAGQILVLFG